MKYHKRLMQSIKDIDNRQVLQTNEFKAQRRRLAVERWIRVQPASMRKGYRRGHIEIPAYVTEGI